MNDNARVALQDLRAVLLTLAENCQSMAKVLAPTARDFVQQFEAAKTIGIVEGYLNSVKEIDKLLAA